MLNSKDFPDFVFIGPDGQDQRLVLRHEAARIRATAALLVERAQPGQAVGLMYPSGPNLILGWLACLAAGLEPLVMQYPTDRQTRQYWENSVRNTADIAALALVVCDEHCASLGLGDIVPVLTQTTIDNQPDGSDAPLQFLHFSIIQLSSGTTGHRKAVRFSSADLLRHSDDYNQVLRLTAQDRVVSWLPLYHDMGYVACFVMPLLLGIEVVMMDPITWVRSPGLLFDAIERHRGTICYMPNFGFEVMTRAPGRKLPVMRWWISCSEPVSPSTARKFLAHIDAPETSFAPCYAMAENIFAVAIGRGIATIEKDGSEIISCGAPIPGVALRIVDGEIWVKSPTSIASYINGADIRDTDGFYPTGDMGELHEGELFVSGRRQDLMIQAGRKYMLSDMDLVLNRLYPDIRGRAAAVAVYDERLGTQKPLVLIETQDFYRRADQDEIAGALKEAMNLDQVEVAFVPPRFLTKTSSGKFNRKLCAEHWRGVLARRVAGDAGGVDPLAELRASFPRVARDVPVGKILDSLSLTVLRVILSNSPVPFDASLTLAQVEAAMAGAASAADGHGDPVLRIVSLVDRRTLSKLSEKHVAQLSALLGCPVTFEHVCLPPSPVVLSDLVFQEYFAPRLPASDMVNVDTSLTKLRNASVILVDDAAELRLPPNQAYGVLSHNLERDPRTDLISVRWQHYARLHHKLPLTFVSGRDLPLDERTMVLDNLAAYLGKPVFRIASYPGLQKFTDAWDFISYPGGASPPLAAGMVNPQSLMKAIAAWIGSMSTPPTRYATRRTTPLEMSDLGHFCSHLAYQPNIDKVLNKYASFCIAGTPSSLPYLERALAAQGKPAARVPSFAPEILGTVDAPYECLLISGAQGDYPIHGPAAALMFVTNDGPTTWGMPGAEFANMRFKRNSKLDPPSATDWFYPGHLHRKWDVDAWNADRVGMREDFAARTTTGRRNQKPAVKIVESDNDDARSLAAASKAALASGDYIKARTYAERAVMLKPDNVSWHKLLGRACVAMADAPAAKAAYEKVMQLAPDDQGIGVRLSRLARGGLPRG